MQAGKVGQTEFPVSVKLPAPIGPQATVIRLDRIAFPDGPCSSNRIGPWPPPILVWAGLFQYRSNKAPRSLGFSHVRAKLVSLGLPSLHLGWAVYSNLELVSMPVSGREEMLQLRFAPSSLYLGLERSGHQTRFDRAVHYRQPRLA